MTEGLMIGLIIIMLVYILVMNKQSKLAIANYQRRLDIQKSVSSSIITELRQEIDEVRKELHEVRRGSGMYKLEQENKYLREKIGLREAWNKYREQQERIQYQLDANEDNKTEQWGT